MTKIDHYTTARAMANLIPNIIQGAHLGFMNKRAITQTQFLVLISLHTNGNCTMGDLAKRMNVRLPTITGMVQRLVKAGYIKRIDNLQDRRQVVISLAPKGKDCLSKFQEVIGKRWETVLQVLTQKELKEFYFITVKIHRKLREKEL